MNIVTEPHLAGEPIADKPRPRPVRMLRWFIIIGLALVLLVGGLVGFNTFRSRMVAQFFANNKPPPATVTVAAAQSEVIPNLLTAVGDLAAVEQGDLASFKAQATVAQLSLDRAKALAARQFGPQVTVEQSQAAFDQANAGIAKTQAIISQKLVRAPFDGELGVRHVEVGQFLTAGTQIVTLTDLSTLYANFTVTEKDSAALKVGQTVRILVDAYPGRNFDGKITTIEPQIATDTRNIRVQATLENPDRILKPGMFTTTTVVLPEKPAVVTVPETAVDYTLYGDSVFLITEKKEDDGKSSLSAVRTFVRTGNRISGRAEILSGLKPGDRVVAVGQLKLQSGSAVVISTDPAPPVPANPPRY